jgi:hypothetical protein
LAARDAGDAREHARCERLENRSQQAEHEGRARRAGGGGELVETELSAQLRGGGGDRRVEGNARRVGDPVHHLEVRDDGSGVDDASRTESRE